MAEKYLYGSLIAAGIGVFAGMYLGVEAVPLLFILATGIFFVIFCYIIGLLKDIRAKLGTHEICSEENSLLKGRRIPKRRKVPTTLHLKLKPLKRMQESNYT